MERFNRRSARPKPLTSLPGADRACYTIFFWGGGAIFEAEILKNHEISIFGIL